MSLSDFYSTDDNGCWIWTRITSSRSHKLQTQCKQGHPFDDENTYRRPNGQRTCRTCNRAAVAAYEARRAGAA